MQRLENATTGSLSITTMPTTPVNGKKSSSGPPTPMSASGSRRMELARRRKSQLKVSKLLGEVAGTPKNAAKVRRFFGETLKYPVVINTTHVHPSTTGGSVSGNNNNNNNDARSIYDENDLEKTPPASALASPMSPMVPEEKADAEMIKRRLAAVRSREKTTRFFGENVPSHGRNPKVQRFFGQDPSFHF